jgi:hypothetical protein
LTFDWSNIDFLSYVENPVVLSHISKLHTLLRKLSHTHALHELSLLLKNFYLHGNFCAYWVLTLNYILVYFEMLFDYFINYLYMRVLKLMLGKKKFCIFPHVFQLLVWSIRKDMFLRPDVLGSVDLLFDSMPSERVCTTSGRKLFAFSAKHTYTLLFACSIMLCCVCVLSD